MENIFLIVICHLIGDYVLQSNFIATTKGSNWYHLFVHCALYVVPFYIFFGFDWRIGILFVVHIVVDPLKARWNKTTYFQDQVIHYATALILYVLA